ncbi:MAG: STAS-like domain-containing protein [Gammaproteobacteria bacterium]|nr:STAS-like domain-containing protein [Gammaproteobacteria bacterium]MBU1481171.1 STAS-like domain-containing protein [Gammaproteobacteria bacterium]
MNRQIHLNQHAHGHMVGSRMAAAPVREDLEITLAQVGAEVVLDFTGISATQSFVDELVGVLVLRHGPDILSRIIFKGCSDDVRAIIEFVVADRCDQYIKSNTH